MSTQSQEERLAILETKTDIVIKSLEDVNKKLDQLPTYATKAELEIMKRKHTLTVWITGTLSAAFGFIMTILIQNYFPK